jgi:hypothetical protein
MFDLAAFQVADCDEVHFVVKELGKGYEGKTLEQNKRIINMWVKHPNLVSQQIGHKRERDQCIGLVINCTVGGFTGVSQA